MNYYQSTTLIFATGLVGVVEKSPHIFVARGEVSYADYIVRIEKENQNFFHIITEGLPRYSSSQNTLLSFLDWCIEYKKLIHTTLKNSML